MNKYEQDGAQEEENDKFNKKKNCFDFRRRKNEIFDKVFFYFFFDFK